VCSIKKERGFSNFFSSFFHSRIKVKKTYHQSKHIFYFILFIIIIIIIIFILYIIFIIIIIIIIIILTKQMHLPERNWVLTIFGITRQTVPFSNNLLLGFLHTNR